MNRAGTKQKLVVGSFRVFIVALSVCASLLLTAGDAVTWIVVTPSELLAQPGTYEGKNVQVHGTVADIEPGNGTSRRYETFKLCESTCVTVFTWGESSLSGGDAVTVRGRFQLIRLIDVTYVDNVIVASEIETHPH